jgi:hypothetical protein
MKPLGVKLAETVRGSDAVAPPDEVPDEPELLPDGLPEELPDEDPLEPPEDEEPELDPVPFPEELPEDSEPLELPRGFWVPAAHAMSATRKGGVASVTTSLFAMTNLRNGSRDYPQRCPAAPPSIGGIGPKP